MIVKWIVCAVPDTMRTAFERAQQQWSVLATAPGFLGQIGGWDQNKGDQNGTTQACVLALWQDHASYTTFMDGLHDEIVAENNQSRTYTSIAVGIFDMRLPMPGRYNSLLAALPHGAALRVADCHVHEEAVAHFEAVQQRVWIPAMGESDGMLGGAFSVHSSDATRYLVTSLWETLAKHARYRTVRVPEIRIAADTERDLAALQGYVVALESQWCVLPQLAK